MFSNQNAEAALLHGADVKEMIEEPMKVRTFAFFSVEDISDNEIFLTIIDINVKSCQH